MNYYQQKTPEKHPPALMDETKRGRERLQQLIYDAV